MAPCSARCTARKWRPRLFPRLPGLPGRQSLLRGTPSEPEKTRSRQEALYEAHCFMDMRLRGCGDPSPHCRVLCITVASVVRCPSWMWAPSCDEWMGNPLLYRVTRASAWVRRPVPALAIHGHIVSDVRLHGHGHGCGGVVRCPSLTWAASWVVG